MLSRKSSTSCWPARAGPNWRRPASASCPTGPGSTWPAGRPRTFSPIRERFWPRPGHIRRRIFKPGAAVRCAAHKAILAAADEPAVNRIRARQERAAVATSSAAGVRQHARLSARRAAQPAGADSADRDPGGAGAALARSCAGDVARSVAHVLPACRSTSGGWSSPAPRSPWRAQAQRLYASDPRWYELTASAAAQDITKPDMVELHDVRAKIEMQDKSTHEPVGGRRRVRPQGGMLTLDRDIVLKSSSGYRDAAERSGGRYRAPARSSPTSRSRSHTAGRRSTPTGSR